MKKLLSLVLSLALAFSLCACGNLSNIELPPLPTVTPEPTPTPEPPKPEKHPIPEEDLPYLVDGTEGTLDNPYVFICEDGMTYTPDLVEAMLIGASGLLDNYRDDAYTRSLKQDFDYFSRKYEIAPMTGAEWNLRDIRPANHPLLRIAQLAAFLASNDFLIDRLVECRTAEEVRRLFSAEASDYWYTHYIPATPTRELPKRIGRMKSDLLGINLVSLIQYAYGAYNGNERLRERAFALLEAIPAEENRFMRRWRLYDLHPANAFQSQALLQLATEYCDRRRCAECPVGRRRLAALRQSVPADESLSRH